MPHGPCFRRFDHQMTVLDPVAQRHHAAHPHALLLRGSDLVADALGGDLTLELREGEEDVEGQPPHRGRGVELLGDRDERHIVASKISTILEKSISDRVRRSIL